MNQTERQPDGKVVYEEELEQQICELLTKEPAKSWTLEELFPTLGLALTSMLGRQVVWHLIRDHRAQLTVDSKLQARGV